MGRQLFSKFLAKSTELEQIDSCSERARVGPSCRMTSCRVPSGTGSWACSRWTRATRRRTFLAWNYSWPDLPKELEDELDQEESGWPDEEVYDDCATRFLVKSMRRQAAHPHEFRKGGTGSTVA